MDERILVVNYKQYSSAFGESGLRIAGEADRIAEDTGVKIILAVPYTMIPLVSGRVDIDVVSQHIDPFESGAYTGRVTVREIVEAGGKGSLLNHSERPISIDEIYRSVKLLREAGLYSIVCGSEPRVTVALSYLQPDIIAMEPPELIGSGVSVSRARPEIVSETVSLARKAGFRGPVLVGAGIVSGEDARKSVDLGADGVLVASAVMKSRDPGKKILELAEALTV